MFLRATSLIWKNNNIQAKHKFHIHIKKLFEVQQIQEQRKQQTCGERARAWSLRRVIASSQTVLTLESQWEEGTFTFCSANHSKHQKKTIKPSLDWLKIKSIDNFFFYSFLLLSFKVSIQTQWKVVYQSKGWRDRPSHPHQQPLLPSPKDLSSGMPPKYIQSH